MILLSNNSESRLRLREEFNRLEKEAQKYSCPTSYTKKLDSSSSSRCGSCGAVNKMSMPMGAHAAFKVRDHLNGSKGTDRNEKKQSYSNSSQQNQQIPSHEMQYNPPVQYNGKLMNSIWGLYNRYSVHNMKSHIAFDEA